MSKGVLPEEVGAAWPFCIYVIIKHARIIHALQ